MRHNHVTLAYSHRIIALFRPFMVAASTACLGVGLAAQQGPKQNASSSQLIQSVPERFAANLKTLSRRMKVTFVVEGQPIGTHTETMPAFVQAALSSNRAVTEEVVREAADYYDYSAVRRGNVFVLTKLYTDPSDVPDVTLQECYLAVKAASQTLSSFNPRVPPPDRFGSPMATSIAQALTPQQAETLSQSGLSMASLAAPQREAVWRMALYYYVQTLAQTAEYSTDFLDALAAQDPLFHWQQVADVFPFGYDFDSPKTHKKVFIPISHANKVAVTPEGGLITMSSHAERNGVPLPDSDPTDPVIKKSGQTPPIAPAITISLAALMAELNRHDRQQMSCQVDVALASKRVTVIGKDEVGASQIMEAVADVYGLRVRHAENGVLILTRLRDLAAPDITRLGKALRGVTPAPLIRALHARMRAQQSPPLRPNQPLPPAPTENDYQQPAAAMRLTMLRELRTLAEPKVRATIQQQLPLSKMDKREESLLAVASAIFTLAEVCWLAERPVPPYIADFDHVVLTGGAYQNSDGTPRYSLFLMYPDPLTGEMRRCVGFFGATLSPHP